MKRLLVFFLLVPTLLFGQSQNPPSVKWKQVESSRFRVVYPQEIEDYALQTIQILDTMYQKDTRIFKKRHPKKIDLYLYNRSVVSNAYAAIAPKRMVWYTTPPSSPMLSLSSWNKILSIHEFRHVTQYSQLNSGFTRLGSIVLGEYGQAIFQNWSTPVWYYEGDAVFTETALSNSGRGRMPSFSLAQRAILLNDKKFSYEKAHFLSYKDFYPNHYHLGYHLVSYINRHYGEAAWNEILRRTAMFSFWPYSFERSLKKLTGKNLRKTYKAAFNELDSIWTSEIENLKITDAKIINKKKKRGQTNYTYPFAINQDTLLVLKGGYDDLDALYYLTKSGKEHKIREIAGNRISYSKSNVVWTVSSQNVRYGEESFSDIVVYNLNSKKRKQITKKGKYFAPTLSHKGDKIVAVEFTKELVNSLIIMDLSGSEIRRFPIKSNSHAMQPVWTTDDKQIIYLETSDRGEAMILLDLESGRTEYLMEPNWIKFDNPCVFDKYVFFNYDYSGITNIYALDLKTKNIFQVTSRKFSADYAFVDVENEKIFFTDYELNGFNIAEMDYAPQTWKNIKNVTEKSTDYFLNSMTKSSIGNVETGFSRSNAGNYKLEKYKAYKNLIHFHSWVPAVSTEELGLMLVSENRIGTMSLETFFEYGIYTNSIMGGVDLKYKKYFPVINLSVESGWNGKYIDLDDKIDSVENWFENDIELGVTVPLNLSRGVYNRQLRVGASSEFINMNNFTHKYFDQINLNYTELLTYSGTVFFLNKRHKGYRDIETKFGQVVEIGYSNAPKLFKLHGEKFYAKTQLFFPGLLKHHSFNVGIGYENQKQLASNNYYFAKNITPPRGYNPMFFNEIKKIDVNYSFPLWYPDINIPYIIFIKRFRANLFYDYAQITQMNNTLERSSAGLEFVMDFNILRFNLLTFDVGVRCSYLIEKNKPAYDLLFLGANVKF